MARQKNSATDGLANDVEEIDLADHAGIPASELAATMESLAAADGPAGEGITVAPSAPLEQDVPGSPAEPVYDSQTQNDIQGNIIPGFNKDHQEFLFYRCGKKKDAKEFLRWLVPYLTSMEEVLAFRKLFRVRKMRLGHTGTLLHSAWVNIAFSHRGIAKLAGDAAADGFGDHSFRQGLAERSGYLGDPTRTASRGHASKWVVGGPRSEADLMVVIGADNPDMLEDVAQRIKAKAAGAKMKLLFNQRGATLPGRLRGHEHFGFRDGVSQPGIRGKLSTAPGDYITPRYFDNSDDRRLYFAKPGQLLTWPGEYLLGEQRQSTEDLKDPAGSAINFPDWAARGSYLVVRRLHQDVSAFWSFARMAAQQIGIDSTRFASMLVGRWPSGAPLMRSPTADNPALGADRLANNHFLFDDDTRAPTLKPGYPSDNFPPATADFLATVCPHFAHIRKVNPRESVSDLGKPEDNLARTILRRGIPFGTPLLNQKKISKKLIEEDRGLMFLCYVGSIEDQFEFLQRRWSNSPVQPNFGGHDPIIGQNGETAGRERFIDFPKPAGGVARLKFKQEWVIPTGGGYFFAPTISAINDVLGG